MKLLIISHALIQKNAQARWRALTTKYSDVHVRLLIPRYWVSTWFKRPLEFKGEDIHEDRFEVIPMQTSNDRSWERYLIYGLAAQFRDYQPDVIFCIHEEQIFQLQQTILYRRLFMPKAKLIYFSMSAFPRVLRPKTIHPKELMKFLMTWLFWRNIKAATNGALVHYPLIRDQMIQDGYKKPILLQTQIGVDTEVFKPDPVVRNSLRDDLGMKGFVIGFVGRLVVEKGVLDLLAAFEDAPDDWQLLFVGDGPLRQHITNWGKDHQVEKRVHITGYVPSEKVAQFMSVLDVFVLGSKTTPTWIDTFPLVVSQAMAMAIPVVASISGAIPYMLGEKEGLLFNEGDSSCLKRHLDSLYLNSDFRHLEGTRLHNRAKYLFCIDGMNEYFYQFLKQGLAR